MKLQYKFKKGDCVDCSDLSTDQIQAVLEGMWELGAVKEERVEGFYGEYSHLAWCCEGGGSYFYEDQYGHNLISWEEIMEAQDRTQQTQKESKTEKRNPYTVDTSSYELFSGTFGEFVERYVEGDKFYALDAGHAFEIERSQYAMRLKEFYNVGVYIKKEPKWYENLGDGIFCWVWDEAGSDKMLLTVISHNKDDGYPFETMCGSVFNFAQPLTKEEAERYIWSAP